MERAALSEAEEEESVSQMEGTVCSLQRQRGVEECIALLTLPDPGPGLQSVSSSCRGSRHGSLLLQTLRCPPALIQTPRAWHRGPLIPVCQALPLSVSTCPSLMSPSGVRPLGSPRPSLVVNTVSPWPFPSGSTQNACVCLIVLKNPGDHFLQEASLTS